MAKQTLDALRARMESLRAEWRELPKRRDNALLTHLQFAHAFGYNLCAYTAVVYAQQR
jgi:hypothetical protein